jgi:poly(A) polymerase
MENTPFICMIQKIIRRILGKTSIAKPKPSKKNTAKEISYHTHHINQDHISKNAIKVTHALQQAGYDAFIVGGAVRDLILGMVPKDFDVATNATPEQVQSVFRKSRLIGRRFQIVHVTFYGGQKPEIIEVSTFRAMIQDESEHITESGRILRDNIWGSQSEDAARRDFTINAMYYNPSNQIVLDYHGGMYDMKERFIRMIGNPEKRYREDPVRMLRAVRFAAKTRFQIEAKTLAPIQELAPLIHDVPSARLFDEILKLLMSGHAWASLEALRDVGLGQGLLPMIDAIFEQDKFSQFAKIALARTDERVQLGKSISPGFLFATLLWHEVYLGWQNEQQLGKPLIPALHDAIDAVLANQREVFAIQRRFETDMREIWSLQPRFERRTGKMPYRLLESPRFRAGYDFLILRCQADELPSSLMQWWEDFQHADLPQREALLLSAKEESPLISSSNPAKSRRRRRRAPKNQGVASNPVGDEQGL